MKEKQEIHCHECGRWIQFDIDVSKSGNHVLNCPICGHEHCRVVQDGKITDIRWDRRNGPTFRVAVTNATTVSIYTSSYNPSGTVSYWHDTTSNTW